MKDKDIKKRERSDYCRAKVSSGREYVIAAGDLEEGAGPSSLDWFAGWISRASWVPTVGEGLIKAREVEALWLVQ